MSQNASTNGRLFLAALPDAVTATRIFRLASLLKRAHGFSGRLIAPERPHVSLFSLGELGDEVECEVPKTADEIWIAPFEVTFDRTASFRGRPGGRPFVLLGGKGLGRLKSFRQELSAEFARGRLKRRANTNFEPHVTLLYDARSVDEYPLAEPVSWTINEIVLIRSRYGHMHLAKWRLSA